MPNGEHLFKQAYGSTQVPIEFFKNIIPITQYLYNITILYLPIQHFNANKYV